MENQEVEKRTSELRERGVSDEQIKRMLKFESDRDGILLIMEGFSFDEVEEMLTSVLERSKWLAKITNPKRQ